MIAGKHMDSIMGVDVHIVNIPSPAGPIPTPLPHPHVGKFFDPMELLPFVGSTVLVGGQPAAYAGATGMCVPHIPMGGPFLKPVGNENEIFMGSATVLVADQPMSRMGDMCLSCSCIGAPPPPRKGKDAGTGLLMPTSTLLATPMPQMVLVGGPPTVVMSGMLQSAAGVGFGWLKTTKKWKKISNSIHAAASKATKRLPENVRNKIHKEICDFTGHPVDIVTGKVFTDQVDFTLNGPLPIAWERTWYSTSDYDGPVGQGWHHSYDIWMQFRSVDGAVQLRLGDGRNVYFPFLDEGEDHHIVQERMRIRREGDHLIVRDGDQLHYRFEVPTLDSGARCPVQEIFTLPGHRMHFRYERGLLSTIADAGGKEVRFEHDDAGRIAKVLLPHPKDRQRWETAVTYRYDAVGNLIAAGDAFGHEMTFEYRGHLLVKETDRNGLSFHFTYDGEGRDARCIHTWGTDGIYDHKLVYDLDRQVTTVENSRGDVTTHYWTSNGRVFKKVDPLGGETVHRFGEASEILSTTDALGRRTEHAYDQDGQLIRTVFPDGTEVLLAYEDGRCIAVEDQVGASTVFNYDEAGRLVRRIDALGAQTTFEYDGPHLAAVTGSTGIRTELTHDEAGNLEAMFLPMAGLRVRRQHDQRGRLLAVLDPEGNTETTQYDAKDRVTKQTLADGNVQTLEYDREDNLTRFHDRQQDIRMTYTGMNKLASRSVGGTTMAFEYDREEDVRAIVNEGGERYEIALDALGRSVHERSFDGLERHHRWDAAGRLLETLMPDGRTHAFSYNAKDLIEEVMYGDVSERFTYRADGQLMSAVNASGEVHFERDLLGRILRETQGDVTVDVDRDDSGWVTGLTSSMGAELAYTRNGFGQVESVVAQQGAGSWSADFRFDDLGREIERLMPGNLQNAWKFDRLGRPIAQDTHAGGRRTRGRTMKWGIGNRLEELTDTRSGAFRFEYDERNWLVNTVLPTGDNEPRIPDAVGNVFRTTRRDDRTYGAGSRLLEADGQKFTYDASGNMATKTTAQGERWSYEWSPQGHLAAVHRPDGQTVTFTYDALGRRLSKTMGELTTKWVWDGNVVLHEWSESSRGVAPTDDAAPLTGDVSTWVFNPGTFEPMAMVKEEQGYSIITDYLGTPNAMFDAAGEEVWSAELDSFGAVRNETGISGAVPFRYQGQYEDAETGLYYNRFRYYDSSLGTYISQDPIGLAGNNPNLYAHVSDSNILVDLLGLSCKDNLNGKVKRADVQDVLPDSVKKTFKDGVYETVVTTEEVVLYRVFGGTAKARGSYASTTRASSQWEIRRDSALLPEWGNSASMEVTIVVPPGTRLQIGQAEKMSGSGTVLAGGGDQVLLPIDPPKSWFKDNYRHVPK